MDKVAEGLFELGVLLAKEARKQQAECQQIMKHLQERNPPAEHCWFCEKGDLLPVHSRHLGRGTYKVTRQCDSCGEFIIRKEEDPNL